MSYVPCEVCKGQRVQPRDTGVKFARQNDCRCERTDGEEAPGFFSPPRGCSQSPDPLRCGVRTTSEAGQPAPRFMGAAQRVKLATELSKRAPRATPSTSSTEPTTGLHFDDVNKLLKVLHRLVDAGNTVIVIEHNLDVIKTADWIIDLGPKAATAAGSWRKVARSRGAGSRDHTGRFCVRC